MDCGRCRPLAVPLPVQPERNEGLKQKLWRHDLPTKLPPQPSNRVGPLADFTPTVRITRDAGRQRNSTAAYLENLY